jgi:DNA-binding MarR family transcriptional regulator
LVSAGTGGGRLNQVSLTAAGRQMLEKLKSAGRRREDRLMADFSKDERPVVIEYLKRLLSQVDYMNALAD